MNLLKWLAPALTEWFHPGFIGSIFGAIAGPVIGGLFGGGGGGSSSPPPAPTGTPPGVAALGGLFSGLGMAGIGPLSNQNLKDAASLADPFSSQRGQYQGPLYSLMQGLEGSTQAPLSFMGAAGNSTPFAMAPGVNPQLKGLAGTQSLSPALQQMMNGQDPSYQFRFDQGLDAMTRQQAKTGTLASGGALVEAERYGQDYASTEFNNAFGRQVQLQQLASGIQSTNFGQLEGVQNIQDRQWAQQFQNLMSGASFGLSAQGANDQTKLSMGSLLANLSGVGVSNPAVSAEITAGKYGQSQDNIANFLRSVAGMFPGLGGMPGGGGGPGGVPPNPFFYPDPLGGNSSVPFIYGGDNPSSTLYGSYANDQFNNTNYGFDPIGWSGGVPSGGGFGFSNTIDFGGGY